jgi:CheY-like chemotaxis protein
MGHPGPLIYVVDDELLLAQILEAILLNEGFTVKTFCDPSLALRSFCSEPSKPLVLVTDYAMQPINGIELLERCRAVHPSVRSVVVSGNAGPEVMRTALVPPDAFLAKPFLPQKLVEHVNALVAAGQS